MAETQPTPLSHLPSLRLHAEQAGAQNPAPQPRGIAISRGSNGSVAVRLPDDLLSIQLDQATGGQVFRPDQHLDAGSMSAKESWRRKLDVTLSPRTDLFGLTVTGGVFDMRQPLFRARDGSRREFGPVTDWRENSVADLDLKLDLADSRLRYTGGLAWAQYGAALSSPLDPDARPKLDTGEGASQWHRLAADLWKGSRGSASIYGLYGRDDAAFRSLTGRRPGTPLLFDGETLEAGGTLRVGKSTLALNHQDIADGTSGTKETTGKLRVGGVSFSLTRGEWAYFDDEPDAWWMRDEFWKGSVKVGLGDLIGSATLEEGALAVFLPDTLGLTGRRTWSHSSFEQNQPPDVQTRSGLELGWTGESSTTDLLLHRVVTQRPATGSEASNGSGELALDLIQNFFGEGWDASAYLSLSGQRSPDTNERLYGAGLSFSLSGRSYPKFSFGLDFNRYEMQVPDFGYGARDQEIRLNVALDFSQYLPKVDAESKPYLKLKAWGDWSLHDDSESGDEARLEPSLLLVFGTRF